ncbi:MAG: PAS domain S-box protein [Deltaproteobacteria bacterium]|nr:PAS domain S-box protein [Deltaproteobacteria bacterium]
MSLPEASAGLVDLFAIDLDAAREDAATIFDRVLPADLPALMSAIETSAHALSAFHMEFRIVRPDGHTRWAEARSLAPERRDGDRTLWQGICHDVTERRTARSQLAAAHDLTRLVIAQAPVSIAIFDREMRYLAVSQRWVQEHGGGREELVGLYHDDVLPDVPEHWRAARRLGLEGKISSHDDDEWLDPSGRKHWLRWAVHPWRDAEGEIAGIIIFAEDATARREAEAGRRESEQRLASIIDSALDGVLALDDTLHVVLANPAAHAIFGYPPGDLVGRHVDALVPAEHRARHAEHVRSVRGRAPGARRANVEGLRADGTRVQLETSFAHVMVGGSSLFTVACRDITEQLRTRRELEAGEVRFRQMAESIREVFWLAEVDTGKLLYVSPAYESVWKRSVTTLANDIFDGLNAVHPDDRVRVSEVWRSGPSGGHDLEYRIQWPDGTTRWLHDRAFVVRDADGRMTRMAGITEDVTARHALEEHLRQTQKMESIGRLAGGVAHDFNNLLTVVVSSAEMMCEAVADRPDVTDLASDALEAALRGAALTRQLLAFTRQEVVEPRVMDLSTVVADTEKMLRRLIGEDVTLVTRLDRSAPPVKIDPGQWAQVVLNLAVNARDAMPRGGRLEIVTRAANVGPGAHPGLLPGEHTVLEVRDDGAGMSADVRSRIFEPFFTTKPRGKGSGLGLAVVYGVVHQAGGVIDVESEPGRGAAFTIHLPAAAPSPLVGPADGERATRGGSERVMLVEDDDSVRRVTARVLASKGYQVLTARDGLDAMNAIRQLREGPDLLVTDVVMPNLDGAELAARVSELHPRTKVLFTSGYIDESITLRGVSSGTSFLQKPYSPAVLVARVREILDG